MFFSSMQFTSTTAKVAAEIASSGGSRKVPGPIPPQQSPVAASSEIPTDLNEEEEQTVFPESLATPM